MSDLYLVDDHAMMRDGLRAVLEGAGHRVVGEADQPTQALADIVRLVPTVLLLDLHLSHRSGFELLEQLLCGFGTNLRNAGDIVSRVSDKRLEVDNLVRANAPNGL